MTGKRRDLPRTSRTISFRLSKEALSAVALVLAVAGCAGTAGQVPKTPGPAAGQTAPTEQTAVKGLEISADGDSTRIRLRVSREPKYSFSVSPDSRRAELDLYNVAVDGLARETQVADGMVDVILAQPLPGGAARIGVHFAAEGEARVVPIDSGLDILVHPKASSGISAVRAAASPQRRTRVLDQGSTLAFDFGAKPTNLSAVALSDGRRLVVDAEGVEIAESQLTEELEEGPVERVRFGRQAGRVRAVLEARQPGAFDGHQLEKRDDGFDVLLVARATMAVAAAGAATASAPTGSPGAQPAGGGKVVELGFRQEVETSRVELLLTKPAPHEVREATGERVVMDLLRTTLPEKFRRALDTSAFPGPVRLIAAYPKGPDTRISVDLRSPAPFRVERNQEQLALVFEGGSGEPPEPAPRVSAERRKGPEFVVVDPGTPKGEGAATTIESGAAKSEGGVAKPDPGATKKADALEPRTAQGPPARGLDPAKLAQPTAYSGQRISLDLVDADIRNVLRLIGDVSGLNIIAGDDVQGKVTMRLMDVPWDQALEVILKTRALGQVREVNVIRIAPAEKLEKERNRILEAEKAAEQKAPLVPGIIPVNYALAQELSDKVKSLLSDRGTVTVDQRTNAILVKDVAENVQEARNLVAKLDTQTPQVLIEARVVEVSSRYTKDLGIQWGGQFVADTAHGNATGWAFPNSLGVKGDSGANNFAINFPSAAGIAGGPGGALAVTMGHINDILTLDLRLSAIETSGKGRVIASPRVATLDNKTAEISQGIEIPFTTATQEKIETKSIDYKLKLNVTPHVTSDRSIIMKIELSKDAPSTTFAAVDSRTPAKETRAATTQVLVKDGETTVIGGIITETQSNTESGIPFLSKLPGLGWLFKKNDNSADKTELIIFITPKIANTPVAARSL